METSTFKAFTKFLCHRYFLASILIIAVITCFIMHIYIKDLNYIEQAIDMIDNLIMAVGQLVAFFAGKSANK